MITSDALKILELATQLTVTLIEESPEPMSTKEVDTFLKSICSTLTTEFYNFGPYKRAESSGLGDK